MIISYAVMMGAVLQDNRKHLNQKDSHGATIWNEEWNWLVDHPTIQGVYQHTREQWAAASWWLTVSGWRVTREGIIEPRGYTGGLED